MAKKKKKKKKIFSYFKNKKCERIFFVLLLVQFKYKSSPMLNLSEPILLMGVISFWLVDFFYG